MPRGGILARAMAERRNQQAGPGRRTTVRAGRVRTGAARVATLWGVTALSLVALLLAGPSAAASCSRLAAPDGAPAGPAPAACCCAAMAGSGPASGATERMAEPGGCCCPAGTCGMGPVNRVPDAPPEKASAPAAPLAASDAEVAPPERVAPAAPAPAIPEGGGSSDRLFLALGVLRR